MAIVSESSSFSIIIWTLKAYTCLHSSLYAYVIQWHLDKLSPYHISWPCTSIGRLPFEHLSTMGICIYGQYSSGNNTIPTCPSSRATSLKAVSQWYLKLALEMLNLVTKTLAPSKVCREGCFWWIHITWCIIIFIPYLVSFRSDISNLPVTSVSVCFVVVLITFHLPTLLLITLTGLTPMWLLLQRVCPLSPLLLDKLLLPASFH